MLNKTILPLIIFTSATSFAQSECGSEANDVYDELSYYVDYKFKVADDQDVNTNNLNDFRNDLFEGLKSVTCTNEGECYYFTEGFATSIAYNINNVITDEHIYETETQHIENLYSEFIRENVLANFDQTNFDSTCEDFVTERNEEVELNMFNPEYFCETYDYLTKNENICPTDALALSAFYSLVIFED